MNEHERLIIAAILRYHAQIPRIVESLRPEMFEDVRHKQLFMVLVTQATTSFPHTVETFVSFLDQSHGDPQKKRELVQYLIALTGEYATIEKASFEHALESLRQAYRRRLLISGVTTALDQLQRDKLGDVETTISRMLDSLGETNDGNSFTRFTADTVLGNYQQAKEGKLPPGIPFGFPKIDAITGGHMVGQFVVFGAYTSEGKTRFGLKATHRATTLGFNSLYVSLEMKNNYIGTVLTCGHTYEHSGRLIDINRAKAGQLEPDDFKAYEAAARDLDSRGKIHLWSPGRCTVADIRRRVAGLKLTARLDLVVVDYIKLVTPEQRRGTKKEELDEIIVDLKHLGMTENVSVIGLHQMSRHGRDAAGERGYYLLEDYGDTSEIERNADVAIWALMTPEMERNQESRYGLAKVREGPKLIEGYMICSDMAHGVLCERNEMPRAELIDRYLGRAT